MKYDKLVSAYQQHILYYELKKEGERKREIKNKKKNIANHSKVLRYDDIRKYENYNTGISI